MMKKIMVFICAFLCQMPPLVSAQENGLDTVNVYLVPMEDFPEDAAVAFAKSLSKEMNARVKSSLRLGDLDALQLPGTNQLISEDIIAKSQPILKSFPEVSKSTYFLILTTKDINSNNGNFRFQFSTHSKELNTSVVSMARLFEYVDGKPVANDLVLTRLYKMTKRAIGEMYLGWKRSVNRKDVMYSPIMSLDDLDSIGVNHVIEDKDKPANYLLKDMI